jgi:hypothetical protein
MTETETKWRRLLRGCASDSEQRGGPVIVASFHRELCREPENIVGTHGFRRAVEIHAVRGAAASRLVGRDVS